MTPLTIVFTIILFVLISLQRTYTKYPLKELRRRARDGDEIAKQLARVAVYGSSLRLILWVATLLFSGLLFWSLSVNSPTWFAVTTIAVFVYLGYVWLPAVRVSSISERFAAFLSPALEKMASFLHRPVSYLDHLTRGLRPDRSHTNVYDKTDLLKLIEKQQLTKDNRIGKLELGIMAHALEFGDKKIIDHMTPKRVVKTIKEDEELGAVVLTELHDSGFSRFPVLDTNNKHVVGTLYLHDLVLNSTSSTVAKEMHKKVFYLHEDQSLHDALQAVIKTHHHLFVVVNSFEEFIGVISSEDVFEALVGKPILDEFDKYHDMRAVAKRAAKKEHDKHKEALEQTTTSEATEVVE